MIIFRLSDSSDYWWAFLNRLLLLVYPTTACVLTTNERVPISSFEKHFAFHKKYHVRHAHADHPGHDVDGALNGVAGHHHLWGADASLSPV